MSGLRREAAAPPVRAVHLGLGSFFRAHQAWYTDRAGDGWGFAAFSGRRPDLANALAAQDGLYTLVTRGPADDAFEVIGSVARAHAAAEHDAWLSYLASPDVGVVTLTVTEAGYRLDGRGRLDTADPAVQADLAELRGDVAAPVGTAPARLLAGLLARRRADAGPVALVPCDNVPGNGVALAAVLRDAADAVDPAAREWLDGSVAVVSTMVDRITPEPTDDDRRAVLAGTGVEDSCPVATEPFSEWVLAGDFPAGRPAWDVAGAVLTDDVTPFEDRKLWLLNGAHSLMAYAGTQQGAETVADAIADDRCRALVEQWWDTSAPSLSLPKDDVRAYRAALLERWGNRRIRHQLGQIAADGSQKLPARFLPVLRTERAAGRLPEPVVAVLAAWVVHLRGAGTPVRDVRAEELQQLAAGPDAVPRVLAALDPALPDDAELVAAVRAALPRG